MLARALPRVRSLVVEVGLRRRDVRAPDAPRARQRRARSEERLLARDQRHRRERRDRPASACARASSSATCTPAPSAPFVGGVDEVQRRQRARQAARPPRPRRAADRRRWPTAPRRGSPIATISLTSTPRRHVRRVAGAGAARLHALHGRHRIRQRLQARVEQHARRRIGVLVAADDDARLALQRRVLPAGERKRQDGVAGLLPLARRRQLAVARIRFSISVIAGAAAAVVEADREARQVVAADDAADRAWPPLPTPRAPSGPSKSCTLVSVQPRDGVARGVDAEERADRR